MENTETSKGSDDDQVTVSNLSTEETTSISKNQLKKLKKREKWLKMKADKRACEREKRKRKFADAREKGEILGPTRKSLKRKGMKDSTCCVRVVIDCSFDDMMTNKDVIHLTQQIQHSYAANRRAANALQYYVSGISGKLKQRIEGIGDYRGWDIYMKEESFETLFKKEEIVYLSSESPNILSTIEDDKVYIIGGFVDHNHYKGYCHEFAEKKGLQHAQLPIGQYIDMKARKVLTINHVFEILLRYTECKSWQEAFYAVLPQRKGAIYKNTSDDPSSSNDCQESNCDNKDTSVTDNSNIKDKEENTESLCDSVSKDVVNGECKIDGKELGNESQFDSVSKNDVILDNGSNDPANIQ